MLLRTAFSRLHNQPLKSLLLRPYLLTSSSMRAFASVPGTRILVKNLPTYWDKNEIASRFGSIGTVQAVNLIKNNIGTNTGKAVIQYQDEAQA